MWVAQGTPANPRTAGILRLRLPLRHSEALRSSSSGFRRKPRFCQKRNKENDVSI